MSNNSKNLKMYQKYKFCRHNVICSLKIHTCGRINCSSPESFQMRIGCLACLTSNPSCRTSLWFEFCSLHSHTHTNIFMFFSAKVVLFGRLSATFQRTCWNFSAILKFRNFQDVEIFHNALTHTHTNIFMLFFYTI